MPKKSDSLEMSSLYRGNRKYDREQIIFAAEAILCGALDRIEDGLPTNIDLEWAERKKELGPGSALSAYERGALEGAGMALAVLYAQLNNDGLGIYDALCCAGDFHKQVEAMMRNAWFNDGKDIKKKTKGSYRIEKLIPNYPDCRKHAEEFANSFTEAGYFSPWLPEGVDLDADGRLQLQWPDSDGEMRVLDEHGNTVELVRMYDEDPIEQVRWQELRDLLPDDALYFQPENAGDDGETSAADIKSFQVYRNRENAEKAHPDCDILAYTGAEIEEPTFLDVPNPKLFWNKPE